LLVAFALPVIAQDATTSGKAAKPLMMARDADPDWEVVTIRLADPNDRVSHINIEGRRVMVEHEPVEAILKFAYGVQDSQIVGGPEWMKTERWDVSGVPDAADKPNLPQLQSMMRKLLTERFGLKLHREQREMPVFALMVAKGGPKMEESTGNPDAGPSSDGVVSNGIETHQYTNASMPDLALMLTIYGDRPIVDQTGLLGRYSFQLRWTHDETQTTAPDAPPGLFTAMQEQIGLKLKPMRAPADVLVVDAVERPSAN